MFSLSTMRLPVVERLVSSSKQLQLSKASSNPVFRPVRHKLSAVLGALMLMVLSHSALAMTPVNINQATAQEIAVGLTGIGAKKAEAIVAYREAYGPFTQVDELEKVKGVGSATLEKNKGRIILASEPVSTN